MAEKKVNEKQIKEMYKKWYETVNILKDSAEANNFMPMVADILELAIKMAKIYEQGYIQTIKNKVK